MNQEKQRYAKALAFMIKMKKPRARAIQSNALFVTLDLTGSEACLIVLHVYL